MSKRVLVQLAVISAGTGFGIALLALPFDSHLALEAGMLTTAHAGLHGALATWLHRRARRTRHVHVNGKHIPAE